MSDSFNDVLFCCSVSRFGFFCCVGSDDISMMALPMIIPGENQRQSFRNYTLIRRLIEKFNMDKQLAVKHYAQDLGGLGGDAFRISDLDDTMDCIRELIATMQPGNDQVRENACHQINVLQGRRDLLLLAEVAATRKRVDYEEVIRVVMASGLLRNAERVREAFHYALQVSVKDPAYRKYLEEQVDMMSSLSPAVIIKNRLIVHMALCLHAQNQMENIAERCEYMVFRTLDLTPERGWEWVDTVIIMCGAITFCQKSCSNPPILLCISSSCA